MAKRKTVAMARNLRRTMTKPEVALWSLVRMRPHGIKIRRQHPFEAYVLDFYCPSARVAIEVDGLAHEMGDNPDRDLRRDRWPAEQGIDVVRIAARDVLTDPEAVLTAIVERCAPPLHQPAAGPPPHARHGEDDSVSGGR